jgi:superoxide reductase
MAQFSELFQSADWKSEKHVPVIDIPGTVKKGETFRITVTIGKEVAHPNKTEHHIRWISVWFFPDGGKFPVDIGRVEFNAHGASADGPDSSGVYTHHEATMSFRTDRPGTVFAASYCNIHGLWRSSETLALS